MAILEGTILQVGSHRSLPKSIQISNLSFGQLSLAVSLQPVPPSENSSSHFPRTFSHSFMYIPGLNADRPWVWATRQRSLLELSPGNWVGLTFFSSIKSQHITVASLKWDLEAMRYQSHDALSHWTKRIKHDQTAFFGFSSVQTSGALLVVFFLGRLQPGLGISTSWEALLFSSKVILQIYILYYNVC